MARPSAGGPAGLQPGSGPARLSRDGPARFPDPDGGAAPDRVSGHLFHRHPQDQTGGDDVFPLLAAAAGEPLPDRAGRGLFDRDPRASPRRHPGDVLHEPFSRRSAGQHAAAPVERGWRPLSGATAGLRGRGGLRPLRQEHGLSDHPLRPLRQPGRLAAGTGEETSGRLGGAHPRTAAGDVPRADERAAFASGGPGAFRLCRACCRSG
jgi:hypothetical protein